MRKQIRAEVAVIKPLDDKEAQTQKQVLNWIDSGAVLCRIKKPATPPKHLVSYFVLIDGDFVLLVDHINAQLWLPTGGHVNPDEHPRDCALREAKEELGIDAKFLFDGPVLITSTETVGKTAGHTDVSIWYALKGDRQADLECDDSEFEAVRWFHRSEVPFDQSDPELHRFLTKMAALTPVN
ncbi:NUDIX hydrolase [Marinicella marina]|nr:NUDIX hydrolase [Marinicella marina]MDJ1138838.1 NUDIX hydrolase [Marinicella marina]